MSTIDISALPKAVQQQLRDVITAGALPDLLFRYEEEDREAKRVAGLIEEALQEEPIPYTPQLIEDMRARLHARAKAQAATT